MKHKTNLVLAAVIATISAGTAFAEQGIGRGPHDFSVNNNHVHVNDTMRKHFDHADQNGAGKVTRAEMDAHMQAAQAASEFHRSTAGPTGHLDK